MKINYYIVDAFTNECFKGNPAGVCILDEMLPDQTMQKIAAENNLPETAFACKKGGAYELKWFTPTFEIDLCGHATLATAFVIYNYVEPGLDHITFETVSGVLEVTKQQNKYEMSFPKREAHRIVCTSEIRQAIGTEPVALYSERDLYVQMNSEAEVKKYVPDYNRLQTLNKWLGVVITAKGETVDFVSRYFCPELGMEDPVTGSSHSTLIPLWSEKCHKSKMVAQQLSQRGGTLYCENGSDDVKISGEAVLYLKGEIDIE